MMFFFLIRELQRIAIKPCVAQPSPGWSAGRHHGGRWQFCTRNDSHLAFRGLTSLQNDSTSASSMLSWNTFLSRTSVSSISRAAFSNSENAMIRGLDDVLRVVKALDLPRFRL